MNRENKETITNLSSVHLCCLAGDREQAYSVFLKIKGIFRSFQPLKKSSFLFSCWEASWISPSVALSFEVSVAPGGQPWPRSIQDLISTRSKDKSMSLGFHKGEKSYGFKKVMGSNRGI